MFVEQRLCFGLFTGDCFYYIFKAQKYDSHNKKNELKLLFPKNKILMLKT